ncbi:amidohydrolase family protein [Gryllotalpicola reticulitermitis]|uniref:Amidohydrolase family protein n=1 Tax=Gryllotalpicola reticulitermitis TaxID=1184153 RepID=A0ABV8Q341_9MICO
MTTVIQNVRVFDSAGLSEPREVIFGDVLIADAATEAGVVIDAAGATLLPGLIDAHVHTVLGRVDLQNLAQWGVTTGLDMAAWPLEFVNAMRHEADVAQIFSATVPAVGPGGNHAKMPGFPADGVVTTPAEARSFVERRVADGADWIKIVTEAAPPAGMDQPTVNAIVQAAHEHGLLVVAHSITTGAFRVAIEAGVDVSTHAPLDAVLDDELVARMREMAMVSVPTLTMMEGTAQLFAARGLRYENARDSVVKFYEAGIRILTGTDANSAPGAPFGPKHGESLHHEFELLVQAGLTPVEVLTGATSLSADTFNLKDRGAVMPGKRADLVLVDGDPTTDITVTRNIRGVWIAGERVR